MHALDTLHTAMRPHGVLLDVRPAPQHPWVEVARRGSSSTSSGTAARAAEDPPHRDPDVTPSDIQSAEGVVRLGQVDDSYRIGTQEAADAALQTLLNSGRLVREREETFTFVYHFDSVETWLAYMAEHWSTARLSADLIARAQRELPSVTGPAGLRRHADELRIPRLIRASRLRRG